MTLLAVLCVAWVSTGVAAIDIVRYLAYEAVYVVGPGVILYRSLSTRPGHVLRQLALGWALGYAAEVLAYTATAAVHARVLYYLWPLLALVIAIALHAHSGSGLGPRERACEPLRWPSGAVWLALIGAVVGVVYLTLGYFVTAPLPGTVPSVSYDVDNVYALSLTAEIVHHWPVTSPSVAGEPLRYYLFAFTDLAAAHQVTGLNLSVELFRLFPGVLFAVVAVSAMALGEAISGLPYVGAITVPLVLAAGTLDLDTSRISGAMVSFFPRSQTFLLAIPLFLAIVTISVVEILPRRGWPPVRVLLLLGVLAAACAGTKSEAAVVLAGGLGVYVVLAAMRHRPGVQGAVATLAVALAATLGVFALFIAGPESLFREAPSIPSLLVLAPLVGIVWIPRGADGSYRGRPIVLIAGTLATGLIAVAFLHAPANSQGWFLSFGLLAAMPLSAYGVVAALAGLERGPRRLILAFAAGFLATVMLLATAGFIASHRHAGLAWYAVTYGGATILALAAVTATYYASRDNWRRALRASGSVALALVLVLTLAEVPVKTFSLIVSDLHHGRSLYLHDSPTDQGLAPGMLQGLLWVRDHSRPGDVLAVNTHYVDPTTLDSRYFYFSAFTQRHVYLEAWDYTLKGETLDYTANGNKRSPAELRARPNPFPSRFALNNRVFEHPDASSIEALRRAGVTFIVVDRAHGPAPATMPPPARRVFHNEAIDVYRIE